jgi:hypothetical protein
VKRSPMPPRRFPMGRGSALRRRTALRPVSAARRADRPRRLEVNEAVYQRDGGRCLLAMLHREPEHFAHGTLGVPCSGKPLTPHHLHKAVQGGPHTRGNLVTLCAGHNEGVEDWPSIAHQLGLVVWAGESVALAWQRLRSYGLVAWEP